MNDTTKLVVTGAVAGVAAVAAYSYFQRMSFAEATASGDFDSAEGAADAAFLHRDWIRQAAIPASLILLLLLVLSAGGIEAGPPGASLPPSFPGYL